MNIIGINIASKKIKKKNKFNVQKTLSIKNCKKKKKLRIALLYLAYIDKLKSNYTKSIKEI